MMNAIQTDATETDGTYARRAQEGDPHAYRVLVERYQGMVFDLTTQYSHTTADAEDLAQDVFLRAYQKLDRLRNPDQFASWLYGIALNRCRDYAKDVRRDTHPFSATEQTAQNLLDSDSSQHEALEADDRSKRLWAALDELSETYAVPFLLKYRDGLSYKAMSKRMDVSVSALKVRVHRARKKLQTLMTETTRDS